MSIPLQAVPGTRHPNIKAFVPKAKPKRSERLSQEILNLSHQLHSQLAMDWIIEYFYRATFESLDYNGLIYQLPDDQHGFSHGILSGHSCTYALTLNQQNLGEMVFYNHLAFDESQMMKIERHLQALINPLRNALLYRDALQQALRDRLTGVRNRAAFDADLARDITLAHRHEQPLSLIVLDIDHFKGINDNHGHAEGDRILKEVAQTTSDSVRTSDQIYRYGGEEFTIIVPQNTLDGARRLAERIRANIYQAQHPELGDSISVSLGVAQLRPGEDGHHLFQRADRALYAAKRNGRNQVMA